MLGKLFKGKGGKDKGGEKSKAALPEDVSYEQARTLARDGDVGVRLELAARPDIKPEILYFLAEDPSPEVRRAIAANAASPMHADLLLARDADESVRGDLAAKIARIAPGLTAQEHDRIRKMAYETLQTLARDQATRVRQVLAEALKDIADAPAAIIRRLARDAELIVCEPILSFSPVLTDEDLIEIIAGAPPEGARGAIARRRGLREKVADALVAADDVAAVAALLGNHSAQIREETLDRIVHRAVDVESWHAPLVRRPALPRKAAVRIARFVADSLIDQLQERHDLSADALEEVRAVVRRRIDEGDLPEPKTKDKSAAKKRKSIAEDEAAADPMGRARALHKQGRLDEETVAAATRGGNRAFVAAALAVRSALAPTVVDKAFTERSAKGLAAVTWKAGLSARLAEQIQSKIGAIPPRDVLRPRADGTFALTPDELEWQIGFLTDLAR